MASQTQLATSHGYPQQFAGVCKGIMHVMTRGALNFTRKEYGIRNGSCFLPAGSADGDVGG